MTAKELDNEKNCNIIISFFLIIELLIVINFSYAFADNGFRRADYLRIGITSSICGYTHRNSLIDEVNSNFAIKVPENKYYDFIYDVDYAKSFEFLLECGRNRELVYAGTFLDNPDCPTQLEFLTAINGFLQYDSSDTYTSGYFKFNFAEGDIVFWLDDEGRAINAGLVTNCHSGGVNSVIIKGKNGDIGEILLSKDCDMSILNFKLVRPIYSSNENLAYLFCITDMHCSKAGACGILANINMESSFRTGEEGSINFDSFGICQWSSERSSKLISWCEKYGYDYLSLEGQLKFMQYELSSLYPSTDYLLKTIENNPTGAYDAGYWTCFEYEQPYEFEFVSADRAELSRDFYWPYYSNFTI